MDFSEKVVIITGASSGIGEAAAKKFAELSTNLVIIGRSIENLKRVSKECEKKGAKVLPIAADISVDSQVKQLVEETIKKFGRIDVLVNNAGIVMPAGVRDGIAAYDTLMATNMRAVYLLTTLAVPHIVKTKGSIIQVSSAAGVKPLPGAAAYCVSKAALNMFTEAIALELAPHGVRVNTLSPGGTITNINRDMREKLAKLGKELPMAVLGRISEADEMADMIVYMAGWNARGMTGSNVFVDNGMTL